MSASRLSVVMPMYNAARFVEAAIDSILAQTMGDFIFYIVDDGSTDLSGDIAARKAATDRRIRLIRQSNEGIVASMNRMLGLVETPFVARMDADDISLPDRFALQLAHFDRTPTLGALGGQYVEIDNGGRRRSGHFRQPVGCDDVRAELELRPAVANPTVMFRTDALRKAGLYRPAFGYCEDYDLFLRLSEIADIDNLPDTLLLYRRSPEQMSVANNAQQTEQAAYARLAHLVRKTGAADPFRDMARLPPLADLDALLKKPGIGRTVETDIIAARRYAVASMADSEFVDYCKRLASGVRLEAATRTVVRCLVNRRVDRALRLASSLVAGVFV